MIAPPTSIALASAAMEHYRNDFANGGGFGQWQWHGRGVGYGASSGMSDMRLDEGSGQGYGFRTGSGCGVGIGPISGGYRDWDRWTEMSSIEFIRLVLEC